MIINLPTYSPFSLVVRFCSIIAFFSKSPWYATLLMIFEFCLILMVSGSSATCVNLPLLFSKSAWYMTFDWIFVFSAIRFNSGVSAIVVAFAFGMCLPHTYFFIILSYSHTSNLIAISSFKTYIFSIFYVVNYIFLLSKTMPRSGTIRFKILTKMSVLRIPKSTLTILNLSFTLYLVVYLSIW